MTIHHEFRRPRSASEVGEDIHTFRPSGYDCVNGHCHIRNLECLHSLRHVYLTLEDPVVMSQASGALMSCTGTPLEPKMDWPELLQTK